ncbi:MAG: hypothetical protein VX780_11890 [Pseudomonadota bacterium]|nr:hypothetical protein [Pseudomonadota bacterium]
MIRVLLIFIIPLVLPTGVYVLWRALVSPKYGGSRVIARDEWEPLPWPWLALAGGILMVITVFIMIAYPEFFDF